VISAQKLRVVQITTLYYAYSMTRNSRKLDAALGAIDPPLTAEEKKQARQNAQGIIADVVKAYEETFGTNSLKGGTHIVRKGHGPTGLVYGRIQSGKTRAMVTSAALALDSGFKIVVVLTSNIDLLVGQTHEDFDSGLPEGATVYSKGDFDEVLQGKRILERGRGGIVIVCSKGSTRLEQATQFLRNIGAANAPALIFDDEGDQASLDTNTARRATRDPSVPVSTICRLIHDKDVDSVRSVLKRHVFVSVTGTPQALLLSNADSVHRPFFTKLLEPGKDYIGGEDFFGTEDPSINPLISLIDSNERSALLGGGRGAPEGLRAAVRYFLVAAAVAVLEKPLPKKGGYKFLCHPSVKTDDHKHVADAVRDYVIEVSDALSKATSSEHANLKVTYENFRHDRGKTPPFEKVLELLTDVIDRSKYLVINMKGKKKGKEIIYGSHLNFLIGGNTLGRGLAIKNLLITYYVREAARTQMDTMYQHARMFGYRKHTLPYTKVFLPPQIYETFREIYLSDERLRRSIEATKGKGSTFPVRIAPNINATRRMVLDVSRMDYLEPATQVFPDYPFLISPQVRKIRTEVLEEVESIFPNFRTEGNTDKGKLITTEQACHLLSLVKTKGTNKWRDKHMSSILRDFATELGDGIYLQFRVANRGAKFASAKFETGTLEGLVVEKNAARNKPTLWILDTKIGGLMDKFIYPTLVIPQKASFLVFNKGRRV
jgi:hypothetical protein